MMQTERYDIVVVGGAYTDYEVQGPTLPHEGETTRGTTFLELPGSKASNQAVEAARMGAHVAFVGRVGADARGNQIVDAFKSEGVDTRYIVQDAKSSTGISLIQVNEHGSQQMMVALGASQQLTSEDVLNAAEAIKLCKVLLTQLEIPLHAVEAAMRLAHEARVQVVFDPAPSAPVPDEILQLVDIIKPDAKEAQSLTGIEVKDRDSARRAAHSLLKRGVKVVAVQAAGEGNLLVWSDGEHWLPSIPVKRVDATGAGDAFGGALVAALAQGRSLREAGTFANAAAALTTTKLGGRTALPWFQDVMTLLTEQGQ